MDYSILCGADGEDGLTELIRMVRFDVIKRVYIVPVKIIDNKFFTQDTDSDKKYEYELKRTVSIRKDKNNYSISVYHSQQSDRYYISIGEAAPYFQQGAKRFYQHSINGKFGPYYLENVNGRLHLVKVITL